MAKLRSTITEVINKYGNLIPQNLKMSIAHEIVERLSSDGVLEDAGDTLSFNGGGVVADTATWFAAADALRLTTNAANSGGGAVRVSMFYIDASNL